MDPDDARSWMADHKSRQLKDKRTSLKEAISRFTNNGDYCAFGGFGHVRVSMAAIYELIRQRRRNLAIARALSYRP
jgi:acyl CoA:acetate/3-ketoacid CoA transferase alpha subunit